MRLVGQLDHLVMQNNHQLLKSVSQHEEASAGVGCFARQSGLIAQQNLTSRVSRTTCLAIITNMPSGWFYQAHIWSLINEYVVLIKQICSSI